MSVHVLAAVILIGPITVAASVFPRYARAAAAEDVPSSAPARAVAAAMHRISRGYAIPAIAVPVFGIGLGAAMGVMTQSWLVISMALTLLAAVLLVALILPGQSSIMAQLGASDGRARADGAAPPNGVEHGARRLGMITGIFAMTWAVVVILMIVRPGSSTGV